MTDWTDISEYQTDDAFTKQLANDHRGNELFLKEVSNSVVLPAYENLDAQDVVRIQNDSGTGKLAKLFVDFPGFGSEIDGSDGDEGRNIASIYDPDTDRIIVAYRNYDHNYYGYCVVGKVEDSEITFGTPVIFLSEYLESEDIKDSIKMAYDTASDRVIISYLKSADNGSLFCNVLKITGEEENTIEVGTEAEVPSTDNTWMYHQGICYDEITNRICIVFNRTSSGGRVSVGKVTTGSPDTISFNTYTEFETDDTRNIDCIYATVSDKIIVVYQNTITDQLSSRTLTITTGTPDTIVASGSQATAITYILDLALTYNSVDDAVIVAYEESEADEGLIRSGSVGTSGVSFGSAETFEFDPVEINTGLDCCYDPDTEKIVVVWGAFCIDPYIHEVRGCTVTPDSASALTWDDNVEMVSDSYAHYSYPVVTYCPTEKRMLVSWTDYDDYVAYSRTLTTGTAYQKNEAIGIAQETVSAEDDTTAVLINGVSDGFTGRTPGNKAYIQTDGTLGDSATDYPFGRWISATELLITRTP